MKKTLLTIGILTLTALAGTLWYLQNNKNETTVPTVSVVTNEKTNNNAEKLQTKEILKQAEKKISDGNEKVLTKKDTNDEIDTSNWKEYCDEKYGFCLKYPAVFTNVSDRAGSDKIFALLDERGAVRVGRPFISATVYSIDPNINFENFIKEKIKEEFRVDIDNYDGEDISFKSVDGKKVFTKDFVILGPGVSAHVLYDSNTVIYFSFGLENIELAKAIRNTLRFFDRRREE